ncbi:MAG: serine/threonine protein kinase [Desulfobacterales bacterium]|nr:serine/threonine protein kinase [Desulfobacterales bacterium]
MNVRLSHQAGDFIDPEGVQFEVLEMINRGGMGTVYRVKKVPTNMIYAVKECDILDDPRGKQMSRKDALDIFYREGYHIESLNCHGIPRGFLQEFYCKDLQICLHCGHPVDVALDSCDKCQFNSGNLYYKPQVIDRRCYIFMDYVDGSDLDEHIRSFTYPLDQSQASLVIGWFGQVAETLLYIHKRDLIHRDIKPQNISISSVNKQVYLLDFGLLRLDKSQLAPVIKKGMTSKMGTDGYAPPEQENGNPCKASDVYAMSMTLMESLTGFKPDDPIERMKILDTHPRSHLNFISPDFAEVIKKSFLLNPANRPLVEDWLDVLEKPFAPARTGVKKTLVLPFRQSVQTGVKTLKSADVSIWNMIVQNIGYAVVVCLFFLVVVFYFFMDLPDAKKVFKATARQGAIVYADMNKTDKVKELSGGEDLRVQDAEHEEYWLEVTYIDKESVRGYISRSSIDIYEE